LLKDIRPGRKHYQIIRLKDREVLTWTVAILNCIHSVGNRAAQTDVHHVARYGIYVVNVDDWAQTVLSAAVAVAAAAAAAVAVAAAAAAVVVVVVVVVVVLCVLWFPFLTPSVPFLRPVPL
jgi:fatty acid desaturase